MAFMQILYPFNFPMPVTQRFAEHRRPYNGGLDLGAPEGNQVLAGYAAKVTRAAWDTTGYGLHVRLQATGRRDLLLYGHLSELKVKAGDVVDVGQVIGLSGNTGNSTGPHLHLEYRPDGVNAVDPEPLLVYSAPEVNPPLPTPTTIIRTGDKIAVMGDYLNIRTGPGTEFAAAGQVLGRSLWRVTDIQSDKQMRMWYQINPAGNWLAGWLCERAL